MARVEAINIPVKLDFSQISDGYHTFSELYKHRHMLYLYICGSRSHECWRTKKDSNGVEADGWFILGWESEFGQISYHLPNEHWGLAERLNIDEVDISPWDGHNSTDVLVRLDENVIDLICD